jgi:hypothetical protein
MEGSEMNQVNHFTVAELSKIVSYDPETGVFFWAVTRSGQRVGKRCGSMTRNGYRRVTVNGISMAAHRVAWALYYGEWPMKNIDHINRDRADNRICNLRLATQSENCTNRVSKNKHGLRGVTRLKYGRWQAQAIVDGVGKYLGTFATKELAHQAYLNYLGERASFLPMEERK